MNTDRFTVPLLRVAAAKAEELTLALDVLMNRLAHAWTPDEELWPINAVQFVAWLVGNEHGTSLVTELDQAKIRLTNTRAMPEAPEAGQLWIGIYSRDEGMADRGFLVVCDVDVPEGGAVRDDTDVMFQHPNSFDMRGVTWGAMRRTDSAMRFHYLGSAPPELLNGYVAPTGEQVMKFLATL